MADLRGIGIPIDPTTEKLFGWVKAIRSTTELGRKFPVQFDMTALKHFAPYLNFDNWEKHFGQFDIMLGYVELCCWQLCKSVGLRIVMWTWSNSNNLKYNPPVCIRHGPGNADWGMGFCLTEAVADCFRRKGVPRSNYSETEVKGIRKERKAAKHKALLSLSKGAWQAFGNNAELWSRLNKVGDVRDEDPFDEIIALAQKLLKEET